MSISFKGAKKYKKHNGFSDKMKIKEPFPSPVHIYNLNIGALSPKPLVAVGDKVLCGQKIADISASSVNPVISSISGTVLSAEWDCIKIENDMQYNKISYEPPSKSADELTSREILWLMRESCVYEPRYNTPLHVLLSEKSVGECIIVCCFDSDPYISSPQAAALGNTRKILRSLDVAMRVSGIPKAYIAVENDTKKTYYDFKYNLRYNNDITLYSLKARYPQSREDILIKTITGSENTRAMIISPETLVDMADVLEKGAPITRKLITVSGDDILEPNNFAVPIGATISSLLESGGYSSPEIVINGGVIEGDRIFDLDEPVTRSTSAILAFNDKNNIPKYRKKLL